VNRRRLIASSVALPFVLANKWDVSFAAPQPPRRAEPFDAQTVRRLARALADKPFNQPDFSLPGHLKDLGYDLYRGIRFKGDHALWRRERLPFEVQFFHRGFLFQDRVQIHQVVQGEAHPIAYSRDLFDFGETKPPPADADLGFAGFRLHAPLNRPNYYDEVGAFVGASYFRAVARRQNYGMSARGLALNTADPKGEEFPAFRSFWIERPSNQARSIVVHALLDSKSAAAAYRFTIRPGTTTVFDVEMTLYPRVDLDKAGIAPLTSMFFFGANDRRMGVDDFRPSVHDSDGCAIRNGRGEELWRPLSNPQDLQVSAFEDANPRGFGLLQRERDFHAYEDIESRFETRPSTWVEPIGNWGEGAVHLVEIPTKAEIHDNIVSYWRPKTSLQAKHEHVFAYRLHWGAGTVNPPPLAEFVTTRIGAGPDDTRRFVLDLTGRNLKTVKASALRGVVSADKGKIRNIVIQPNPVTSGWRMVFELAPENAEVVELRAQLMGGDSPASEVWLYRWTP
jgi:periplasmic glucans biosynthesis protein